MPISFTCPHCGKQTTVADDYAGQSGPCKFCGETITVPGGKSAATLPPVQTQQSGATAPVAVGAGAAAAGMGTGAVVAIIAVVCVFVFLACGGVLVALLLPAVQAAREAARRTQCNNNLKQIAIAFQNYNDTYGTFPPAYIPDEDGKPMHSWRVLILPFIEQQGLHQRYDFDEPWDSPNNRAVTDVHIPAFTCPSSPTSTGSAETNYMVITGPGTVFDGAKAAKLAEIKDGTSNTLLVVEVAGAGTNWAEPVDLDASKLAPPFSAGGPDKAGSHHPGGMNGAMCDGSVQFISDTVARETLDALISKDGEELVGPY